MKRMRCIKYGDFGSNAYPVGEIMQIAEGLFINDSGDEFLQGWVEGVDYLKYSPWLLIPEELEEIEP